MWRESQFKYRSIYGFVLILVLIILADSIYLVYLEAGITRSISLVDVSLGTDAQYSY